MGVADLLKHLGGGTVCNLFTFGHGRVLAIDASVWLHELASHCAASIVVMEDFTEIAALYVQRIELLNKHGISTVSVFDGCAYPPKRATSAAREALRQQAIAKVMEDPELHARNRSKFLLRAVRIVPQLVQAVIYKLRAGGHSLVVAPFEADAQLTMLALQNVVDAVITCDQDLIVHGVPRVICKVDYSSGACRLFSLARIVRHNTSTGHALADLIAPLPAYGRILTLRRYAALAGCDYLKLDGIAGMGAIKLLKKAQGRIAVPPSGLPRPPSTAEVVDAHGTAFRFKNADATTTALSAQQAAAHIDLCCSAFADAPAYDVYQGAVVTLSLFLHHATHTQSWLRATALGINLRAANSCGTPALRARALGYDIAPVSADVAVPSVAQAIAFAPIRDGDPYLRYRVPALVSGAHVRHLLREGTNDISRCSLESLRFFFAARGERGKTTFAKTDLVRAVQDCVTLEMHTFDAEVVVTDPRMKPEGQLFDELIKQGRVPSEDTDDGREMRWLDPSIKPPTAINVPWVKYDVEPHRFFASLPSLAHGVIMRTFRSRGDSDHMKTIRIANTNVRDTTRVRNMRWLVGTAAHINGASAESPRKCREDWVSVDVPASFSNTFYKTSVLLRVEYDDCNTEELPAGWVPERPVAARVVHACCSTECVAGLSGLCWHVAYVLVTIAQFSSPLDQGPDGKPSPTSLACAWARPAAMTDAFLQPTASYVRSPKPKIPRSEEEIKLRWYNNPALLQLLGRQAVDPRPAEVRELPRDDPDRVVARRRLYDVARVCHGGQACGAEVMFDTPADKLKMWVPEVERRRKRLRQGIGGDDTPLPWEPLEFTVRGGITTAARSEDVSATAAVAARDARKPQRAFVQKHPHFVVPHPAEGRCGVPGDPKQKVFCWYHGYRKSPNHIGDDGECKWLTTNEVGKATKQAFVSRFYTATRPNIPLR